MTLKDFFEQNPKIAVAFSGGVDSSYLLYAAREYGAIAKAYFMKTVFQPQFEVEDAKRLANDLGAEFEIIDADVLENENVRKNDTLRCYYCKTELFTRIINHAKNDGFDIVVDGSTASDDAGDRAGMRAVAELGVRSPLRECGLDKEEIRRLSEKAGLFTWDKPAYACLATRLPVNTEISEEMLEKVEKAEDILYKLGFSDLRVRVSGKGARLEIKNDQMLLVYEKRGDIIEKLSPLFTPVTLDLKGRV